jgi:limonene-1,2-epoxide hydrolase
MTNFCKAIINYRIRTGAEMDISRRFAVILVATATLLATGASARTLAEVESANEALVRAFIAATSVDLRHYRDYLADNVTFQYEGTRIEGRDVLIAQAARKMSALKAYKAEVLRLSVVGDTVLNERADLATLNDGQQIRLVVTSVFVIAGDKIVEWREYPLPPTTP